MKEQIKTPKIELRNEEIANLSDTEFKTLVIRMLTEMVEYGCKIEEKVQAMNSKIKENVQATNSEGKETGTQINSVDQRKKETSNQKRMKKQEFGKKEERLRNLQDTFKRPHIQITGVPEGEEEQQEIKNLVEKNNGELPQSGKGNRLPVSPASSKSPKELGPKEAHTCLLYTSDAADDEYNV